VNPKADIGTQSRHARFVPEAEVDEPTRSLCLPLPKGIVE